MELTLESGQTLEVRTRADLERALADLGSDGNEFAILARAPEIYIQAAGTPMSGFVVEYRDGSEAAHFQSRRTNHSREETIALFASYLEGTYAWKAVEWVPWGGAAPAGAGARRGPPVTAILLAMLGLGALGFGLYLAKDIRAFVARSATTTGTVVSMDRSAKADYPVVRFSTADGRTVEFRSQVGSRPPRHRIGETVPVRYDPEQPTRASIDTRSQLWSGPIFLGAVGLVFCLIALASFLRSRRAGRASSPRPPAPEPGVGSPAPRSDRGLRRR